MSLTDSLERVFHYPGENKSHAELLRLAADEVDAGWVQESYEGDGGVCTLGAINKAVTGHAEPYASSPDVANFFGIMLYGDEWYGEAAEVARRVNLAAYPLTERLETFLHKYYDLNEWETVPDWNDREGRTKKEVSAMLRAAADKFEQEDAA